MGTSPMMLLAVEAVAAVLLGKGVSAFVVWPKLVFQDRGLHHRASLLPERHEQDLSAATDGRRQFLAISSVLLTTVTAFPPGSIAVERAVGSAELKCRAEKNCLEKGEWDGAVGWQWGGKDRCDSTDPLCGPDGVMRDSPVTGAPIPASSNKITHQAEIRLAIGRNGEEGTLRFGLYGDECPVSTEQMVELLSPTGLSTTSKLLFEEGYSSISDPITMVKGGALNLIVPDQRLDFGVPSQAAAFAKRRGMAKAGDNFIPQPRPRKTALEDGYPRKHDVPGLISMPGKGLGYGASGFASEDEAFSSAFQVTAAAVPSMDREGRRVVGQIVDTESMACLARLATLPTSKGIKGVIPGQNSGPPLLRVSIQGIDVRPVNKANFAESSG